MTKPYGKGKFPVVILISGSGRQNRNEEIFGHKPFLVIADYLTRNGMAVFRYDDRGMGESEKGNLEECTTIDFATDTEAAISYLKTRNDIDLKNIGLVGHSEGGIIAFMLAAKNKDVSFVVSLAGSAIRGDSISFKQNERLAKQYGMNDSIWQTQAITLRKMYSIVENATDTISLKADLMEFMLGTVPEQMRDNPMVKMQVEQQMKPMLSPWIRFFFSHDPAQDLKNIKCPVLALNGEKDMQVIADDNLPVIERTLKNNGNKNVTVIKYPDLNHLFQHSATGMPDEYEKIEETFSPEVLKDMKDWILKTVKK